MEQFLAENPRRGTLRILAFRGDQVAPIPGVEVTVTHTLENQPYLFFQGVTDQSGVIESIMLPAPPRATSLHAGTHPSAVYHIRSEHPNYQPLEKTVDIYESIQTVQPLQLNLKMR